MFANSAASPYPSPVTVSGLVGGVANVQVTLFGINNDIPDDMNVMLVSPNNKTNVLLMSHVGGSTALANTILTFSDTATPSLPDAGPIVTGKYKTYYRRHRYRAFPSPAPAPHVGTLGSFAGLSGTNLNGAWNLYIVDDRVGPRCDCQRLAVEHSDRSVRSADCERYDPQTGRITRDRTDIAISIGDDQPGVAINVTATPSSHRNHYH